MEGARLLACLPRDPREKSNRDGPTLALTGEYTGTPPPISGGSEANPKLSLELNFSLCLVLGRILEDVEGGVKDDGVASVLCRKNVIARSVSGL